jgi:hypothetical protein
LSPITLTLTVMGERLSHIITMVVAVVVIGHHGGLASSCLQAGMVCKLQARASVIAVTNPKVRPKLGYMIRATDSLHTLWGGGGGGSPSKGSMGLVPHSSHTL